MSEHTWVYLRSESNLWTVGYYKPDGSWEPESDHESAEGAAARVHYLNGGPNRDLLAALERLTRCPDVNFDTLEDETVRAMKQAHAAIAKAKGEGA